jgi:SAM-dependent methyltransferase
MPGEPTAAAPYDPIAELYDLEHAEFDDDISLMRSIADVVGDPVVEFGCGSGRVLLPTAKDGFDVTGVDSSAAMLQRLGARAADSHGGTVTPMLADLRDPLPLPSNTFGVGIFALNGLMHLDSQAKQLFALREAARILDPRGQLVIDLFNPTPDYLTQLANGPHLEGVWTTSDDREVEKWSHRRLRTASQHLETRIWYDSIRPDGTVSRVRTGFTLRYLHAAELELLLDKAGFVEWQLYGSYELDPYVDSSERLIALAELVRSG